ncbi:MAG: hypothetical protein R3Y20_07800 [Rikenellaceae bacterium]
MEYNLQSHEMIYIGDDISDVMACRDAGVRCLSAAYATTKSNIEKLEIENPDNIFYTVESLIDYLRTYLCADE